MAKNKNKNTKAGESVKDNSTKPAAKSKGKEQNDNPQIFPGESADIPAVEEKGEIFSIGENIEPVEIVEPIAEAVESDPVAEESILGAGPNGEVITDEKELQDISGDMQKNAEAKTETVEEQIEETVAPTPVAASPEPVAAPAQAPSAPAEPVKPVVQTIESILNQAELPAEFLPVTATSNHPDEMKMEKFLRMRKGAQANKAFPWEVMSSGINMSRFGMLDARVGKFKFKRQFVSEQWTITIGE